MQAPFLQSCDVGLMLKACNERSSLIQGHVYCLASDEETHHGKALVKLTERVCLFRSLKLYPMLGSLFLPLMVTSSVGEALKEEGFEDGHEVMNGPTGAIIGSSFELNKRIQARDENL